MNPISPEKHIELEVWVHVETDMALLVSLPADRAEKIWLPKVLVEVRRVRREHAYTAYSAEITLPEWLALDRGLL